MKIFSCFLRLFLHFAGLPKSLLARYRVAPAGAPRSQNHLKNSASMLSTMLSMTMSFTCLVSEWVSRSPGLNTNSVWMYSLTSCNSWCWSSCHKCCPFSCCRRYRYTFHADGFYQSLKRRAKKVLLENPAGEEWKSKSVVFIGIGTWLLLDSLTWLLWIYESLSCICGQSCRCSRSHCRLIQDCLTASFLITFLILCLLPTTPLALIAGLLLGWYPFLLLLGSLLLLGIFLLFGIFCSMAIWQHFWG